ncbi:MAG: AraC family transcriptional regulator [Amaricoccus sp.]
MNQHVPEAALLPARLLAGLARFRRAGGAGTEPHGPQPRGLQLFSYCALSRERLVPVVLSHPLIGMVLGGRKEVWRGEDGQAMPPGTMFVLPARVPFDIWNVPDAEGGSYQSLILEIRPEDVPDLPPPPRGSDLRVRLTPALVAAAVHAASALGDGAARATVRAARVRELLALLSTDPAAAPLFDRTLAGRVAQLLRGDLAYPWTASEVAARLALSESTLRRRLAAEGTGFAALLRAERMQAARVRIAAGAGSQAAALAVGYASRAHFARAYRAAFGENPGTA